MKIKTIDTNNYTYTFTGYTYNCMSIYTIITNYVRYNYMSNYT